MERISLRTARTVVVGLGYVGLPFAVLHARAGFSSTGIEANVERMQAVNEGRSYIEEVSTEELARLVGDGRLRATSSFECVADADVIAFCVPTPLHDGREPDVSYLEHVLDESAPYWRAGQLLILESTTYPGTTREHVVSRVEQAGFRVGEDIFVAFAPERIDPGNTTFPVERIPHVVGGVTPLCTEIAVAFYRQIIEADVVPVSSPEVAELTKLLENVFRVVNVSLVNELAQACDAMHIDVWEVIGAAKTKPFGFMPFYPGPGIGGHCVPVDPFYLSWRARQFGFESRFIELAGNVNDGMPSYVADRICELLVRHHRPVEGARVLLLGMAFKANVADTRSSPSIELAEALLARGATVSYHDPFVPVTRVGETMLASVALTEHTLHSADIVVVATAHSQVDYALVQQASRLVYDTRNALSGFGGTHIFRLGAAEV
jgi:UDP-N-acetyl-D-glucosamine dehydrogenase